MKPRSLKTGVFKTRTKLIKARPVTMAEEIIIDKNGETFVGVLGDWHIWDENGYEYFMDKYSFKAKLQPWNERALNMVCHPKIKKIKKKEGKEDE